MKNSRTEKEVFIRDLYVWRAYMKPNFKYSKVAGELNIHRTTVYSAMRRCVIREKLDQNFRRLIQKITFTENFEEFKRINANLFK